MKSLTSRRFPLIFVVLTAFCAALPMQASILFYTSRASFNAAQPGLPVQGFSGANLFNHPYVVHASPLNSATSDAVFAAGSILPGIAISNLNTALSPGLIVELGAVGDNYFGDALVLSFSPGVSAVGTDVIANTSPGLSLAGNFTETVYNGSTLLGSRNFSEAAGTSAFIGVFSTTPITSVDLLYTTDDATTFASNIAFGSQPASVPEPSSGALLALGVLMVGCHCVRRYLPAR